MEYIVCKTLCVWRLQDIENVYQIQVEEFQHALDAERQSHERTKHNKESLDKQLDTMLQELKEKNNQVWKTREKSWSLDKFCRFFISISVDKVTMTSLLSSHGCDAIV